MQLPPALRQAVVGLLQAAYRCVPWTDLGVPTKGTGSLFSGVASTGNICVLSGQVIMWCDSISPTSAGNSTIGLARANVGVLSLLAGTTGSGTLRSVPVTPAQIVANTDNYAPTAGCRNYRLSTDASRDITGLSISQVDGQECYFFNVGSFNIVLKHDVTSTAANRFLCAGSADITLTPNDIARLMYDSTSARWRVGKL